MRQIILVVLAVAVAVAQPRILTVGNNADPAAALAPGGLAVLTGLELAGTTAAAAAPLPASLGGVTVSVGGVAARLSYVSPGQIVFQVPGATVAGVAGVRVTTEAGTSETVEARVKAAAPGIYVYSGNRGLIQNQDLTLNGAGSAARAGSVVTVYLTGIGATNPAVGDGEAAPRGRPAAALGKAAATIGGAAAEVQFLGLTPGEAGLAQANVVVPNVGTGDLPLMVSVNGEASREVLVAVAGVSAPPPAGGAAPEGLTCASGRVESVVFSLEGKTVGLADEIVINGTKLCAKCDVKAPAFVEFVRRLEASREDGTTVDACYDGDGRVNAVQLRR